MVGQGHTVPVVEDDLPADVRLDALVVDDDALVRTLLEHHLARHGFRVESAACGADALQCVRSRCPDVVLLDVRMPGMDGFAVCRALKEDPATREVPVIFVTAEEQSEQRVRGFEVGGSDYVTKSASEAEVVARARTHARFARLAKALRASRDEAAARAAALAESESRIRAIVNTAADGIITIDERGTIESFNEAAERVFGYTSAEILNQNITTLMPESFAEGHRAGLQRHLETGTTTVMGRAVEVAGRRKDGTEVPLALSVSAFHAGKRRLFTGILRDISERKQAEAELEAVHEQLLDTSRQAGMAEIATSVLHNVGNVLNSVNVSANLVAEKVRQSKVSGLVKATQLMGEHAEDLGTFVTHDEKGKRLPGYLTRLSKHLTEEQAGMLSELRSLSENVEHIKQIVSMQQSYTGVSGVVEPLAVAELLEDALKMSAGAFERHGIQVIRDSADIPEIFVEKHKLLQILVNLIRNAEHALVDRGGDDLRLVLRITAHGNDDVRIEVIDNGVGIPPENLTQIFAHGFTTKEGGHGFGLHSSALAAKELGGSLTAHSDGPGTGATFTLEFPLDAARRPDATDQAETEP